MFDKLLEKIKRVDEIESRLLSIFEGKSWEHIAKALYQILDDIDTADDMCKENVEAFRNIVMKLQAKKNQFLHSPDSQTVIRVDERIPVDLEILAGKAKKFKKADTFAKRVKLSKEEVQALKQAGFTKKEARGVLPDLRSFWEKVNENLTDHARRELELAGMFDKEVDGSEAAGSWNRLCAEAVIELMEVFAEQGHSGFSASMTQDLFSRLARYEKLTELTDNPDEWNDISEMQSGESGWQSQRSPSCFSEDGGKTYWDIDEDWNKHEDEDGSVWSGGLSEEEWKNRPIHQSKHNEKKE